MPGVALGFAMSGLLHRRIQGARLRAALLAFAVVSGAALLAKSLLE